MWFIFVSMRYLQPRIEADLERKMVFVGGPRQCGKTTLAKQVLAPLGARGTYLNWDSPSHREDIRKRRWPDDHRLVVFDELHKYGPWRNWLKGLYDTRPAGQQYLVTGSARLDLYRRGGDSLLGRNHYWRLHPFCLAELPAKMSAAEGLRRLMEVGGFPEPFLEGDARSARRWRRERLTRVMRDDVRDLETLRDLSALQHLVTLLRQRVGGMVVLANLAADLQVAPRTVKLWLEVLERLYVLFVVRPYAQNITRALTKPPKVYFFDNADVEGEEGARFENLVATHLLKRLQFLEDRDGYTYELRYIRDKEHREVDFAVIKDGAVDALIEVKWSDETPSRALQRFAERLRPRRVLQIVGNLRRPFDVNGLQVRSALDIFRRLDQDL